MNFDTYQNLAERTSGARGISYLGHRGTRGEHRLFTALLGLCGEAGELADCLKKVMAHGHPYDEGKVVKEAGDVQWTWRRYAPALASHWNTSPRRTLRNFESVTPWRSHPRTLWPGGMWRERGLVMGKKGRRDGADTGL